MAKLTVCGGGNAAHVLIALAGQAGWEVDVFAPLADEAERLQSGIANGGGMMARTQNGTIIGRARRVSANPGEVIPGSTWVLLALPAFAHGPTLAAIADYLEPGVVVGALPARGGFDYQAFSILDMAGLGAHIFGLQTLPWACRIITYGQEVEILGTKATVDMAGFPAAAASGLALELGELLGLPINPISSFLTLTLANTGQLIHPGIMCGLTRGKETMTFTADEIPLFYQGVDQPTADLLQAMSDEVQYLAGALADHVPYLDPEKVISLSDWLLSSYPADIIDSGSLRRAFVTNRAYTGLKVPTRPAGPDRLAIDFKARYLAEDIPFGLVVIRGLAELAGAATPTLDEVIQWGQSCLGKQYLVNGRLAGPDLAESRAPQCYGIRTLGQLAASS